MDLGVARLRKVGINNLHCAVHPRHGVVWSDGKGIYLAPIHLEGRQVQNAASVKLGEFENVSSVHWSNITSGDCCHLCVIHQQNVTVWRVSGTLPKLNFKQVRKINVRPVPQGCLWNPSNDVLCLLSRQQCSFYFRHDLNKGSYAFPALESGSIVCGCWSADGAKLIICVGTVLLIYRWPDISASLDAFAASAWRIPGLEGKLTSIAPVLKDSIVVAAEVPLESLCKQSDLFKVPDSHGDGQKHSDGVIRPLKNTSPMNSLMNLQHNSEAISESRSTLTVVHLSDRSRDPVKLSTVPLKGVLTPDILIYEKSSHCVIVGSNSQSQLHIYALLEKHLAYCGNIQLDKNQRPKGLCSIPNFAGDREAALLILVGHRSMEESGFLSTSLESEFKLSLKYIMLKAGSHHHSRHSHHGDSSKETLSEHTKSSSLGRSERIVTGHHGKTLSDPSLQGGRREQQMPSPIQTDDPTQLALSPIKDSSLELEKLVTAPSTGDSVNKKQLIEDLSSDPSHEEQLHVDRVSFVSQAPSFNNSKLDASFQLEPITDKINVGQANSVQNSVSETLLGREGVGDVHVKPQMEEQLQTEQGKHKSSLSMEKQLQTKQANQKILNLSMEEQIQTEQIQHKSSSTMEEQLQTEQGKHKSSSSMEEQLHNEQMKHLKSSSPIEEQLHPEHGKQIRSNSSMEEELQAGREKHLKSNSSMEEQQKQKPNSSVEEQLQAEPWKYSKSDSLSERINSTDFCYTELGKNSKSDSTSERINSTDFCQTERHEGGCRNTNATNDHTHKSPSPSLEKLENSNQASILSTSTPVLSQTDKINLLTHLHSEIKRQITTMSSVTNKESPNDLSSSDMVLQTSLMSPQADSVHTAGECCNSMTDSALQLSSISSQTDNVYTSEDFSSLLTDRRPEVMSISSQTEADSLNCFSSSSNYSIKVINPSNFSQTEQDFPTELKPETKSISSQTEKASPVHFPIVESEVHDAKDRPLQIELNTSNSLNSSPFQVKPETSLTCSHTSRDSTNSPNSSQFHLKPEASSTCSHTSRDSTNSPNSSQFHVKLEASTTSLHSGRDSSEPLHTAPTALLSVSDERSNILDLNHQAHELGQAKEDMLSDFGLGSSQHSIDSSWDALEKEARTQKDSIDALHRRLELLASSVDKSTCVFPTKYQDMSTAEIIEIYCEKPEGTETKKFLLDNGRLQLEPIKLSFDLATVELWLDGIPCVAGANIDGYIPLKFSPSTRLHITGRPANK